MTLEQVYENIISEKFTWLAIFDMEGERVGYLADSVDKKITPQDLKEYIERYVKNAPNIYTFHFKKYATQSATSLVKYKKVACSSTGLAVQNNFDPAKERERIRLELIEEQREEQAKFNYEAKTKELDTVVGKAAYLIEKLFLKYAPQGGALQGSQINTNMSQSDSPVPLDQLTAEQKQLANEALLLLLSKMSPELFHKMAVKLHNKPELILTLKSFL